MLAASKTTVTRGKRKVVGFEGPEEHGTFQPFGTQCNRARIGCIQNIRALGKNTLWYSDMSSLFSHVEDLAGEFMPTEYNLSIKAARSAIHWQNFQLVNGKATNTWGAFAASINSYLNVHEDLDFGYSAMMCLAKKEVEVREDSPVLAYFCLFPSHGISVPIRHGDVLLFNPSVPHCVSSRTSDDDDVAFVTLYLKTLVVSLNDNSK